MELNKQNEDISEKKSLKIKTPVNGEEKVVDADHDRVPGWSHVATAGREAVAVGVNAKLCEVENQPRSVRDQEDKNWNRRKS